jgi:hypothetical protein
VMPTSRVDTILFDTNNGGIGLTCAYIIWGLVLCSGQLCNSSDTTVPSNLFSRSSMLDELRCCERYIDITPASNYSVH